MSKTEAKRPTPSQIRKETEKPMSQRKEMPVGRGGKPAKPRKYHMTKEELAEWKALKEMNGWANPYFKRTSLYYFQVQALHELGDNEYHSFKKVFDKTKELMKAHKVPATKTRKETDAWSNFVGRKPKDTVENSKDPEGRIMQNFKVLQRIRKGNEANPYGEKLQQCCMCIDIKHEDVEGLDMKVPHYRLNTTFEKPSEVAPLHEGAGRRKRSTSTKPKKAAGETAASKSSKSEKSETPASLAEVPTDSSSEGDES